MHAEVFRTGQFKGVSVANPFAVAALQQAAVTVALGPISWPAGLAPTVQPLGSYTPGETITAALSVQADVLILLYTDEETSALLEVFTGNNAWTAARKQQWCGYGHNFAEFKPIIQGISEDPALEAGIFGYLYALRVGTQNVVLYKSELHPKQNGTKLPFVAVIQQLVAELQPALVLSTGTAGAIGAHIQCGDVAVTTMARFHVRDHYPTYPAIDTLSADAGALSNSVSMSEMYLQYAATHYTKLSVPGLAACYKQLQAKSGFSFVKPPAAAPAIYAAGNPVPGPQPMAIVSADYLTVDDSTDLERLQALGVMNDTDDAFAFFALQQSTAAAKPQWISVRNASEPQIVAPAGATMSTIQSLAGTIYGIYQYCTTLNSAFACWGIIAGRQ